MRAIWPALAVGLFATAAQAELMGTIPIGPISDKSGVQGAVPDGTTCGTTLTWKVNFQAGKDYAFLSFFDRYGTATLRAPGGAPVMSFPVIPSSEDMATGHEAHATSTGTYFLDITIEPGQYYLQDCSGDGNGYGLAYQYDCRGGRQTQCTLPVGATRQSYTTFPNEWDWWRTTLQAGRRYNLAASSQQSNLVLRDARGRPVASADGEPDHPPAIRGFLVRTSGTYFVDVEGAAFDDLEPNLSLGSYTVSLTAR